MISAQSALITIEKISNKYSFVKQNYKKYFNTFHTIPTYFDAYNCAEIIDYATTVTTHCGMSGSTGSILVLEEGESFMQEDIALVKSIKDEYEFTRKRTLDYLKTIDELPKYFNPYNQCSFTDYASTVTTSCNRTATSASVLVKETNMINNKIRKLTPVEYMLFMGMTIEDTEKMYAVDISDSSMYKQAGNGIVTNCVQLIFEHMYKSQYDSHYICSDETTDYKNISVENKIPLTANILFSGVGMQDRGIKNSNCFDLIINATSEIDKEAIVSYAAIHCGLTKDMIETYADYPSREQMIADLKELNIGYDFTKNKPYDWNKLINRKSKDIEKYWLSCKLSNNKGDISKISDLPYADLWTFSFPCTSISTSGKMEGIIKGKTKSGLLYEVMRLLQDTDNKPKYLLMENVKTLCSDKFKPQFNELCKFLNNMGYNNYGQIMNAKDFGIPQNRERVFMLSIRKDIDTMKFTFPNPFNNGLRLSDLLLDNVDDKYYITDDALFSELLNSEDSFDESEYQTPKRKSKLLF